MTNQDKDFKRTNSMNENDTGKEKQEVPDISADKGQDSKSERTTE